MNTQYYIFGASGHGKVVADIVLSAKIQVTAILDDRPQADTLLHIPVHATASYTSTPEDQFIIAIGSNEVRKKVVEQNEFSFFKAIAPTASISSFAEIEEGTVVMPQVVVNAGTQIGKHCILNSGCVVEHDCVLEDYVHISPNAALAGHVSVGEGSQIGIGASVIQCITIGKWVTIGAGTVVIKDVPDYAVVVGNPGRIIKYNDPDFYRVD
ncbi:acetyltransferase [Kaistella flava (ex Peng et al. 2021)]|uniref:Acetyltransferase n=1 Tax=Kaistella flava (ex Peng et al. 2021) TaxID=2038776 RepID=A0A7M2Y904_9FLAO|nr:acetyltransferase [Kaistella flava (ex Peng et al. 2021)]QOW10621.1 acetyltransferase [Kaistella flava (ex Peng et al. 2021)]